MTYQGERARPMAAEYGRCFEVSKVRIGADGHVSDVLWSEVETGSDRVLGARVLATDAEVVDAIHDGAQVAAVFPSKDLLPERSSMVTGYTAGKGCITFGGGPPTGRNVTDMGSLDD